jgi:CBS domain-containing protein
MRQTRQVLIPGTDAINIQDQTEIKALAVLKFNPNLEVHRNYLEVLIMALKVREVMTSEPVCCTSDTNLRDVARLMKEHDCGLLPVVDNEQNKKPIGTITDRDIAIRVVAEGKNPLELTAGDCMTSPCITVHDEDSLEDCINVMQENQIRRIVVVDKNGKCAGIVAQADIARKLNAKTTAEVVEQISEPNLQTVGNNN